MKYQPLIKRFPCVCQLKFATGASNSQSQTRDVAKLFRFKKSSTVILTNIVSIDGQLISMDSWVQLLTTNKTLRYIKQNLINTDRYASENSIVPVVMKHFFNFFEIRVNYPSNSVSQMLAFACTFHKVKGFALPSIVVSSNLNRQKKFS